MEDLFLNLIKEYGYIILYFWSIVEGESGIIITTIISHIGDTSLKIWGIILAATLGGFSGDQLYFLLARYNKKRVNKKLHRQRRRFALAHLLLRKYGWYIIFAQRFLFGLRVIMPMAIGLTSYSYRKYALINLLSSFIWAVTFTTLAWHFKDNILEIFNTLKENWYVTIAIILLIISIIVYYFKYKTQKRITKGI